MTGGKSLPFFISHAHFLLKQFPDNFCRILHSEIIGLDTEIIIFHIAPVRFCKMLTVNRALVVHLFTFAAASSTEMRSRSATLAASVAVSAEINTW